jgi:hypothetical protein
VTLTIRNTHAMCDKERRAYWYRIFSEAMRYFLRGRQLPPPPRLRPA